MMKRAFLLACVLLCLAACRPVAADLAISIGDASIVQGQMGTIAVTITGDGQANAINNFGFQLQITGTSGYVQFAPDNLQNYSYLNYDGATPPANAYPPYIFYGNSTDYLTASDGGSVNSSMTGTPNDTFTGQDSTYDDTTVSLGGTTTLLAILNLDTSQAIANQSYTISLVPGAGSGSSADNPNTYFDNVDFTGTGSEVSHVGFTSNSGTITVLSAPTVVPEPSSLVLLMIGGAPFARSLRGRWSRKLVA